MQFAMLEALSDPVAIKEGQPAVLSGTVLSCEPLADDTADGKGCRMLIRTDTGSRVLAEYSSDLSGQVPEGCRIEGKGVITKPKTARNPGCFDYALYLRGRRVYSCCRLEKARLGGVESAWRRFYAVRRQALEQALTPYLSEEQRAVLNAMLFGSKSLLQEETYTAFQRNGTAHVLAVSGLHVGMLYSLYLWFFGRKRSLAGHAVLALLLFSYAALAGFSPSVVRAGTMIGIHTAGRALHARYDMLTGTMTAAALILAVSPYQLLESGFQLSFLAVLLLAFLQPVCEKRWLPAWTARLKEHGCRERTAAAAESAGKWLLPLLLMQAGMMPLTAYLFNYWSLSAFAANLPLVFLASMIVPAGILLLLVLCLPAGAIFVPLVGALLRRLLAGILYWNRLTYLDGALSFDTVSPPRWVLFLFYGLLFLLLSEWTQIRLARGEVRRCFSAAAVLAVCIAVSAAALASGFAQADIVFVDVGQGDCVHVRADAHTDLLLDGGGSKDYDVGRKTVKPYLLKNRVRRIDAAVVTHLDLDHYGGIVSLCRDGMVDTLILYEGNAGDLPAIAAQCGMPEDRIRLAGAGDSIRAGCVTVCFVGPLHKGGPENEQSLVMVVEKEGRKVVITGDVGAETEKAMADYYQNGELDGDILQVPHHGSRFSSSETLLEAVTPSAAVVQVGYNHYGHPAAEVLARYEAAGIRVYRNDLDGAVGIDLSEMRVFTMVQRGRSDP